MWCHACPQVYEVYFKTNAVLTRELPNVRQYMREVRRVVQCIELPPPLSPSPDPGAAGPLPVELRVTSNADVCCAFASCKLV